MTQAVPPELGELDRDAREVAEAASPSDVFRQIHRTCRRAAPRSAIFLVRQGEICGWNGCGHGPEALASLRAFRAPLEPGWRDGSARPEFGQAPADESRLFAVEVKGRPIAFVLAQRTDEEEPWLPEALGLLATVARLRLELDVAWRKLETAARSAATHEPPELATEPELEPVRAETRPSTPSTGEIDVVPHGEPPERAAARRYARLVATDIRLYHEDEVVHGQREGDLIRRLGEQLELGKQTFVKRHGQLGAEGLELLREAYVNVLAGGRGELIPPDLLG